MITNNNSNPKTNSEREQQRSQQNQQQKKIIDQNKAIIQPEHVEAKEGQQKQLPSQVERAEHQQIQGSGQIIEVLPNTKYKVTLSQNTDQIKQSLKHNPATLVIQPSPLQESSSVAVKAQSVNNLNANLNFHKNHDEESKDQHSKCTIVLNLGQILNKAPPREKIQATLSESDRSDESSPNKSQSRKRGRNKDQGQVGSRSASSTSSSFSVACIKETTTMEIQMRFESIIPPQQELRKGAKSCNEKFYDIEYLNESFEQKLRNTTKINISESPILEQNAEDNKEAEGGAFQINYKDINTNSVIVKQQQTLLQPSIMNGGEVYDLVQSADGNIKIGESRKSRLQRFRDHNIQGPNRENPLLANKGHVKYIFQDSSEVVNNNIVNSIKYGGAKISNKHLSQYQQESISKDEEALPIRKPLVNNLIEQEPRKKFGSEQLFKGKMKSEDPGKEDIEIQNLISSDSIVATGLKEQETQQIEQQDDIPLPIVSQIEKSNPIFMKKRSRILVKPEKIEGPHDDLQLVTVGSFSASPPGIRDRKQQNEDDDVGSELPTPNGFQIKKKSPLLIVKQNQNLAASSSSAENGSKNVDDITNANIETDKSGIQNGRDDVSIGGVSQPMVASSASYQLTPGGLQISIEEKKRDISKPRAKRSKFAQANQQQSSNIGNSGEQPGATKTRKKSNAGPSNPKQKKNTGEADNASVIGVFQQDKEEIKVPPRPIIVHSPTQSFVKADDGDGLKLPIPQKSTFASFKRSLTNLNDVVAPEHKIEQPPETSDVKSVLISGSQPKNKQIRESLSQKDENSKEEQKTPLKSTQTGINLLKVNKDKSGTNSQIDNTSISRGVVSSPARSLSDNRMSKEQAAQKVQSQSPVLVRPKGILKRGIFNNLYHHPLHHYSNSGVSMSPNYAMMQRGGAPEKKGVRFEARVKIHEFEKYLEDCDEYGDQMDDSSDGGGDDSEYDQSNQRRGENGDSKQQAFMRKNSLSVAHGRQTSSGREIDLFSPAAIIKRAKIAKIVIPQDDAVFRYEYPQLIQRDREFRKRIFQELKNCRTYYSSPKKRVKNYVIDERVLRHLQKQYARGPQVLTPQQQQMVIIQRQSNPNFKLFKKTIVFDLDNTLVKAYSKKHQIQSYDAYVYMNILNSKKVKLFLSYRAFAREMLEQLSQDFELILYSAQDKQYTTDLAKLLTLAPLNASGPNQQQPPPEQQQQRQRSASVQVQGSQPQSVFTHILSKEECIYNEELDKYVVDLDVVIGQSQANEPPRDLADIIFITDAYSRVQGKHARNVIPVSSFAGNKKDFTMVALGRYLKQTFSGMPSGAPSKKNPQSQNHLVYDVREKIQRDFDTTKYL